LPHEDVSGRKPAIGGKHQDAADRGSEGAGRVVGGEIYYDQVSLLTQLDLLPEPSRA
jgi:hypothetical protein